MTRDMSAVDAGRQGDGAATPGASLTTRRRARRGLVPAALALVTFAAACGGDAPLPSVDAAAPEVPFIDQYDPAGKDARYDGTEYCGPALLAGIAKARGQTGGLTDAALITQLATVAGTQADGTTANGMLTALHWLGMQWEANQGADLSWINDQLAAGHDVIAAGDFYALPDHQNPGLHSGHYIAVTAAAGGWRTYRVTEPAGGGALTSLTDAELRAFMLAHPQFPFALSAW